MIKEGNDHLNRMIKRKEFDGLRNGKKFGSNAKEEGIRNR